MKILLPLTILFASGAGIAAAQPENLAARAEIATRAETGSVLGMVGFQNRDREQNREGWDMAQAATDVNADPRDTATGGTGAGTGTGGMGGTSGSGNGGDDDGDDHDMGDDDHGDDDGEGHDMGDDHGSDHDGESDHDGGDHDGGDHDGGDSDGGDSDGGDGDGDGEGDHD